MKTIEEQLKRYHQRVKTEIDHEAFRVLKKSAEYGRQTVINRTQRGKDPEHQEFRYYRPLTIEIRLAHGKQISHVDLTFEDVMLRTSKVKKIDRELDGYFVKTIFANAAERYKAYQNQIPLGRRFWAYGKDEPNILQYMKNQWRLK